MNFIDVMIDVVSVETIVSVLKFPTSIIISLSPMYASLYPDILYSLYIMCVFCHTK